MSVYQYVNNRGVLTTIEAPSAQEALKAPDIGKNSGVMAVGGGAQPSSAGAPTTPIKEPTNSSGGGDLLTFKDSLNKVVQLAKEKRNALSLDFMKPFQGTVAASDFNSILGNLNQASDTFTKDTLKLATESVTPKYKTDQVGSDLYQYQVDPVTGQIIGEPVKILSGKSGSGTNGSTNKITLTEAQNRGLPLDVVGLSEEEIAQSFTKNTPPAWFVGKVNSERNQTVLPSEIQTLWDKYRADYKSSFEEGGGRPR